MLAAMLAVALLVLLAVWAYRYVQYRRAARLAQMRWLHFATEAPAKASGFDHGTTSFDWPEDAARRLDLLQQHQAHMLSPILEERGRESMDSLGSARRDLRKQGHSYVSYGSMELP